MFHRLLVAVLVVLTFGVSATARSPASVNVAVGTHRLIVEVANRLGPAADKKLVVLVLISERGGAPAGGLATPSKPLTVLQEHTGVYRVRAVIDSSCRGGCDASYGISGSADHRLQVIPSCRLERSRFVCSNVRIVKVY